MWSWVEKMRTRMVISVYTGINGCWHLQWVICVTYLKKLTYDSQLGIGEHPPVSVLCHALVHADVRQVQAADRQHSVIHLKPVLLERCSTNVIIPESRRFALAQPDNRQQTVSDKATIQQRPNWALVVANCFKGCCTCNPSSVMATPAPLLLLYPAGRQQNISKSNPIKDWLVTQH